MKINVTKNGNKNYKKQTNRLLVITRNMNNEKRKQFLKKTLTVIIKKN